MGYDCEVCEEVEGTEWVKLDERRTAQMFVCSDCAAQGEEDGLCKRQRGVSGVWTPNAKVLCLTCHGEALKHGHSGTIGGWEQRSVVRTPSEREALTFCDECSCAILVREDVARLKNFGLMVGAQFWQEAWGGWQMEQSGGMTANLSITLPQGRVAIVYDPDDANDPRALGLLLYPSVKAWSECESDPIDDGITFTDSEEGLSKLAEWAVLP